MAFRNWKQEFEDQRSPRPSLWPFVWRAGVVLLALAGLAAGALWYWPGYLRPRPWQRPGPPPTALTVFFASDLGGHLEPCGCTGQRWGGVARLAGYLDAMPAPPARLLVDVGDGLPGAQDWQILGQRYYLQALAMLGCSAVNVGTQEAALSAEALAALSEEAPVPLVSLNVTDARTGAPLLPTHRQLLIGNLRVTVTGVVQPDLVAQPGSGLALQDLHEPLGRFLTTTRVQTDVIVLLAACDEATMRAIAQAHPELDLIVGGRVSQQASRQIEQVGACRIAYHAKKGQILGRVDMPIRPNGRPGEATAAVIVLTNEIPEAPAMLDLVEQYNGELAARNRQGGLPALGVPVLPVPAEANRYVGSDACRGCHAGAYAAWQSSDHSRAYASLVRRRRDGNPDCVRCHVVDLGAGDGFQGVHLTPDRLDVQCESCHGRAGEHVRARAAGAPSESGRLQRVAPTSCETCHDWVHSPEFNYQACWDRIRHGKS